MFLLLVYRGSPAPLPRLVQTDKAQPFWAITPGGDSGSSSVTTASESCGRVVLVLISRLVILIVPSVTEMFTEGTIAPSGVAVPPVQVMTKSPMRAVNASPGTWLGTPPLAIQVSGSCALA